MLMRCCLLTIRKHHLLIRNKPLDRTVVQDYILGNGLVLLHAKGGLVVERTIVEERDVASRQDRFSIFCVRSELADLTGSNPDGNIFRI